MSDIPVGSPPVPPGRHAAPSGWYPDPVDARQERYWDGWQWSRNTRGGGQTPEPYGYQPTSPAPAAPYGYPQHQYAQHQYAPVPPQPVGAKPPVLTADGVPVSGWWWRVLATVIDNLIMGVLALIICSPIYLKLVQGMMAYLTEVIDAANAGASTPPQPDMNQLLSTTDQIVLIVISVVVNMIFIVLFLRWKSATPGKLIVGLRVKPVDQGRYAGKLSWRTILIRAGVWVLPGVAITLIFITIVDALFPLWQPKRQALHDLLAKTQVVKIN